MRKSLNESQRALLDWLSARVTPPFVIECDGPDLALLISRGLVGVSPPPTGHAPMFGRVRLTEAGWELLECDD